MLDQQPHQFDSSSVSISSDNSFHCENQMNASWAIDIFALASSSQCCGELTGSTFIGGQMTDSVIMVLMDCLWSPGLSVGNPISIFCHDSPTGLTVCPSDIRFEISRHDSLTGHVCPSEFQFYATTRMSKSSGSFRRSYTSFFTYRWQRTTKFAFYVNDYNSPIKLQYHSCRESRFLTLRKKK